MGEGKAVRPKKRIVRDVGKLTEDQHASTRVFTKGRHSNAPPETLAGAAVKTGDEEDLEIQVGEFTLVVKEAAPDTSPANWNKYSSRPAVGYGAPGQDAVEKAATTIVQDADEEPPAEWGEWTTESIITEERYYRADSRLL